MSGQEGLQRFTATRLHGREVIGLSNLQLFYQLSCLVRVLALRVGPKKCIERREVRPDSPQGLCLGGHRGNGQPGRALGLPGDLGEEAGGVGGGEGLGAEVVHDLQVVVDVLAFVQVEGAGELLDVHHVRHLGLAEAQHGE